MYCTVSGCAILPHRGKGITVRATQAPSCESCCCRCDWCSCCCSYSVVMCCRYFLDDLYASITSGEGHLVPLAEVSCMNARQDDSKLRSLHHESYRKQRDATLHRMLLRSTDGVLAHDTDATHASNDTATRTERPTTNVRVEGTSTTATSTTTTRTAVCQHLN